MTQEDCPHDTRGLSPWHRRAVPMTQEGCRYGRGGHPHSTGRLWKAIAVAQEGIPMAQQKSQL